MGKTMNEEWQKITDTNYLVSNLGSVKHANGVECKQINDGMGRMLVRMKIDGIFHLEYVDILVATAFVDNPHGYAMVEHIDKDQHNNKADNLRWSLKWLAKSICYQRKTAGKAKDRTVHQYLGDKEVAVYKSGYEAAMSTGISRGSIYKALDVPNRTAGGYVFKTK